MTRTLRSLPPLTLILGIWLPAAALYAVDVPPAEHQLAAAVLAAPADRRDDATVLGYDADGKVVTLRKGSNDLVCLADNPTDERYSVACYHRDLEPYMARGRELAVEGIGTEERNKIRWQEVADGKLDLAREPRTLYVLHGSGFDADAGEVSEPFLRWVIYVPYATGDQLGLPTAPAGAGPWLMFPGTAGAHIMITPPRPN